LVRLLLLREPKLPVRLLLLLQIAYRSAQIGPCALDISYRKKEVSVNVGALRYNRQGSNQASRLLLSLPTSLRHPLSSIHGLCCPALRATPRSAHKVASLPAMPAAPRPLPALLYSHSYQPLLRIRRTAVKSKAPLKVRPGVSRIRLSSILYKTLPNKEPGRQRLHAPRQEEGKEKPERPPLRIRRFVARSTAPPSQQLEVPSQRLRVPGRRPIRVRIQTQPDSGHKTPHNKIEGEEKGHERRVIRRLVRPFRISPGQKETRLDLGNRARIIKLGSFLEDEGPGFSNDFQSTQDEKNPRNHIRNKTDDSKSNSGIMASDDAYAAFLEKANQPTSDPTQAIGGSGGKIGTYSVNRPVPEVLQSVEEYYVSDSDEPFEGVSLAFGGDKLDVGMSSSSSLFPTGYCNVVLTSLALRRFPQSAPRILCRRCIIPQCIRL
jgi:hypothetical protein